MQNEVVTENLGSFEFAPMEIIFEIAQYFDFKTLISMNLVSKSFNILMQKYLLEAPADIKTKWFADVERIREKLSVIVSQRNTVSNFEKIKALTEKSQRGFLAFAKENQLFKSDSLWLNLSSTKKTAAIYLLTAASFYLTFSIMTYLSGCQKLPHTGVSTIYNDGKRTLTLWHDNPYCMYFYQAYNHFFPERLTALYADKLQETKATSFAMYFGKNFPEGMQAFMCHLLSENWKFCLSLVVATESALGFSFNLVKTSFNYLINKVKKPEQKEIAEILVSMNQKELLQCLQDAHSLLQTYHYQNILRPITAKNADFSLRMLIENIQKFLMTLPEEVTIEESPSFDKKNR